MACSLSVRLAFALVRAQLGGEFVQNAVYETVAFRTAEGFGDFNRFVDDDGVGRLRHFLQFVRRHQQHAFFNRVNQADVAVGERTNQLGVLLAFGIRAEKICVNSSSSA